MKRTTKLGSQKRIGERTSTEWKALIANTLKASGVDSSQVEGIVDISWRLGEQRAELLQREFLPYEDPIYILSLFCWWPFKPSVSTQHNRVLRKIWSQLEHSLIEEGRPFSISYLIPDELLTMDNRILWSELNSENLSHHFQRFLLKG